MTAFEQGMAVSLLPGIYPEKLYLGDGRTQVRRLWPFGEGEMQGKWVGFVDLG